MIVVNKANSLVFIIKNGGRKWNENTHKKIDKVENVSYVAGASVASVTTGHYTTVAVRKDGSYYDLDEIINR